MKRFMISALACLLGFGFTATTAYADPPPGRGYNKNYYKGNKGYKGYNGYRGNGHYKGNYNGYNGYRGNGHWNNDNWNRNGYYWNGNNWVAPFVTGALVGGVIGYALAPKPGVQYQQQQVWDPQCNCYRQAMVPVQ